MMKKLIAMLMIAALALCGFALAEDMTGNIEDGCYVIRMKTDDLGWIADEMAQDDSVVKLESAEFADGFFTVKYAPTGDGDVTVDVRHFTGIACDQMHTWDLTVKDGAVQEVIGGSYTASPDPSDFDAYLLGDWETEDGMTLMTISKNPSGRAWDVETMCQKDEGAYDFVTTIYYDCELDSFVYDKGKFWMAPDGESEEEISEEATVAGTTGRFAFIGDDEANLQLDWYDDQGEGETVVFNRHQSDYTYYPESEACVGTWISGDYSLEIVHTMDDYNLFNCNVTRLDADGKTGESWLYDSCAYDDVGNALSCEMIGIHSNIVLDENGDLVSNEDIYTDGAASFALNEDGTLTWTDCKKAPGEDQMVFTKVSDEAGGTVEGSDIYTEEDVGKAADLVEKEVATWDGIELIALKYAGDECDSAENIQWLSELKEVEYAQVLEFLADIHTTPDCLGSLEPDTDYSDYEFWLGRTEGGEWEFVTFGY